MTTPLFIGGLGPPELLLIAGVLILLFGASKLPKLARSMGSATGEFNKGREQVEGELDEIRNAAKVDGSDTTDGSAAGSETDADLETETEPDLETETERDSDVEQSGT